MEERLAKVLDLEPVTMSSIKLESPVTLISNSDKEFASSINIPSNESPKVVKKPTNQNIKKSTMPVPEMPPKCVTIPNVWNLEELKVSYESPNLTGPNSDTPSINTSLITKPKRVFDSDWELI